MTKILNAKEFISEKLDIQPVSKDRLKQAVDEMVKLYLYGIVPFSLVADFCYSQKP